MTLPKRIGRYEILGLLGTGGMAEVLLARMVGPNGFQRPVVIKRILPHLARQSAFVDMFIDEARLVAGIRHNNVVQVQEFNQEGDDLYLVMEYLEGESLASLTRRLGSQRKLLSFYLCAHVIAEAAAGLHAAHELVDPQGKPLGVVHRDVSPSNIFVTYDGAVKILDFGIATADDRLSKTEAGHVKGKYAYMSPEQCKGEKLDRRSDLFSLGIVLFELSTCRRLFKRATELHTLEAICIKDATPPSSLVAGYPRGLEDIALRALSRNTDARYQSAAEMRRDLVSAVRELNSTRIPEETLSSVMHRLFADRIEEKKALLSGLEAGRVVSHVPSAEVDESVDLPTSLSPREPSMGQIPQVTRENSDSAAAAAMVEAIAAPTVPQAWIAVAFGILIALFAGLAASALEEGVFSVSTEPLAIADTTVPIKEEIPPARTAPEEGKDVAPAALTEVAPTLAVEAPTEASIEIVTDPKGARVYVEDRYRGLTPLNLTLKRGETVTAIRIDRKGYVTVQESVVPDKDQRIKIVLDEIKRRTSETKPSKKVEGYRRFE